MAAVVPLAQIAHSLNESRTHIPSRELSSRAGRFLYVGEKGLQPFDDYSLDGLHLILGAFCNIKTAQETFATQLLEGKIQVSNNYHVLRCDDDDDTRYLRYILANTSALPYITGDSIAERLESNRLAQVRVPWPSTKTRRAYTKLMSSIEQETLALPEAMDSLLTQGDALFAQHFSRFKSDLASVSDLEHTSGKGSAVLEMRPLSACAQVHEGAFLPLADKGTPVFSPRGAIGQTAHSEALATGPVVILGVLGNRLGVQYCARACAPNAQTVWVGSNDTALPLGFLFFALRAVGERIQADAAEGAAWAAGKDGLEALCIPVAEPAAMERFADEVAPLLERIDAGQRRHEHLRVLRWKDAARLFDDDADTGEDVCLKRTLSDNRERTENREQPSPGEDMCLKRALSDKAGIQAAFAASAPGISEEASITPVILRKDAGSSGEPAGRGYMADSNSGHEPSDQHFLDSTELAWLETLFKRLNDAGVQLLLDELIWEILPLAFMRAKLEPDLVLSVASLRESFIALAQQDVRVTFLRQFASSGSLLTDEQLQIVVAALNELDPTTLTGEVLAAWYARSASSDEGITPLPQALRELLQRLFAVDEDRVSSVYDPFAGSGEMIALAIRGSGQLTGDDLRQRYRRQMGTVPLSQVVPCQPVKVTAQASRYTQELLLRLVVALENESPLEVQTAPAPLVDVFELKAERVVCFPSAKQGDWTDVALGEAASASSPVKACFDPHDARWILGVPPRNKANFAWIMQAIAHMQDEARAFLLLTNAVLHAHSGIEASLRASLAQSGLVEAVIALPGRIFADGRPPCSILVLRKQSAVADRVLFIDAQELGVEKKTAATALKETTATSHKERGGASRVLPLGTVKRIAESFIAFCAAQEEPRQESGFSRVVSLEEIANNDNLLTPWTYVHET